MSANVLLEYDTEVKCNVITLKEKTETNENNINRTWQQRKL
jgi:hypothetical protein